MLPTTAALLCAAGGLLAGEAQAAPLFPNASYSVGENPAFVAAGDFNGDGRRDLALANRFSEDISILLGRGDGSFQVQRRSAPGDIPVSLAVADFNQDGYHDIAAALPRLDRIAVLLSLGDGRLGPPILVEAGDSPGSIVTADLNGDGRFDLVAANFFSNDLSVLPGLGDGTFGPQVRHAAGTRPQAVAVALLHGDALTDLVTANWGSEDLSVLAGTGPGDFAPEIRVPVVTHPGGEFHGVAVAAGDLDENGIPDLVAALWASVDEVNRVVVVPGLPGGGFGAPSSQFDGFLNGEFSMALADFDRDTHLDLALTGHHGINCCFTRNGRIFPGRGDGTLAAAISVPTGNGPTALAVADFDADGRVDLAIASDIQWDEVTVLLGDDDGIPGRTLFPGPATGPGPESLVTADLNGDGDLDLVVANAAGASLTVMPGDGVGGFVAGTQHPTGPGPGQMALGEFDGDGIRDLAVSLGSTGDIQILRGSGDGSFLPGETVAAGPGSFPPGVADLDGDGRDDLIVPVAGFPGEVHLYLATGPGQFSAPIRLSSGVQPAAAVGADLNRDGLTDLVVTGAEIAIHLAIAPAVFGAPAVLLGTLGRPNSVVADFNRDGNPDLATGSEVIPFVMVRLGQGDGTFGPVVPATGAFLMSALSAIDLDGDGRLDLALSDRGDAWGALYALKGRGDGTFEDRIRFRSGECSAGLAAGDFDADGRPDLAATDPCAAAVQVFLNSGPFPNRAPRAQAEVAASVECTSAAGAVVGLDGRQSSDEDSSPGTADDIVAWEWFEETPSGIGPPIATGSFVETTLSLGTHTLLLKVTDTAGATGETSVTVSVVDTTAPSLALQLNPARLWPPRRQLVEVRALAEAADACSAVAIMLESISISEPESVVLVQAGSDVVGAEFGTADFEFLLRAARLGSATGRTYTVRYLATDASGNTTAEQGTVLVPHSLTPGNPRGAPGAGRGRVVRPPHTLP